MKQVLLCLSLIFALTACTPYETKHPQVTVDGDRAVVSLPACPDWSSAHNSNYGNGTFSNYGCAHSANLVKMVEDPADLVAPQATSGPDVERNLGAIQQYRAAPGANGEEGGAAAGGAAEGSSSGIGGGS